MPAWIVLLLGMHTEIEGDEAGWVKPDETSGKRIVPRHHNLPTTGVGHTLLKYGSWVGTSRESMKMTDGYYYLEDYKYDLIESCDSEEELRALTSFIVLTGLDNYVFMSLAQSKLENLRAAEDK